jgi:hypothetical protein
MNTTTQARTDHGPQHVLAALTRPVYERMQRAIRIADAAVAADIETGCPRHVEAGRTWYDTRPMLDPREHSPEMLDMATDAIQYGVETGLLVRHAEHSYLVRVEHHRR